MVSFFKSHQFGPAVNRSNICDKLSPFFRASWSANVIVPEAAVDEFPRRSPFGNPY